MSDEAAGTTANGPAAAAVLAAGIGGCVLGVLSIAGDAFRNVARALNFWNPTGPLSGVTDITIIVWLVSWFTLSRLWGRRSLELSRVNLVAAVLIIVGLLLTFPPFSWICCKENNDIATTAVADAAATSAYPPPSSAGGATLSA